MPSFLLYVVADHLEHLQGCENPLFLPGAGPTPPPGEGIVCFGFFHRGVHRFCFAA